jgi:hypothetical protein
MTKLSPTVLYKERTLPSFGFYGAATFVPVALFLITLPFSEEIGLLVALMSIVSIFALSWVLAPLITITAETLSVGKVRIETKFLGNARQIEGIDAFVEGGQRLDTRAFTRFQIGVKQLVKIEIVDEQDPTPYWLIATRNPEVIAGIINKL